MTLLFKRSGRDDKTPFERFHRPEVILRREGGSGRVVSHSEAWPPKTVSKLGFTPDGRKAKERILESAEML
jgi:hypothetical protein